MRTPRWGRGGDPACGQLGGDARRPRLDGRPVPVVAGSPADEPPEQPAPQRHAGHDDHTAEHPMVPGLEPGREGPLDPSALEGDHRTGDRPRGSTPPTLNAHTGTSAPAALLRNEVAAGNQAMSCTALATTVASK